MVELRKTLFLSLDGLLAVTREFINEEVSRSGLARCLSRHEVSSLREMRQAIEGENEEKTARKTLKDYEPGFVHVDIKYLPKMPGESQRRYLFVGIDRTIRWVYFELLDDKGAQNAASFLRRLTEKAPFKVTNILTDNGKEFTDRFQSGGERKPTGNHVFDKTCDAHEIEHRLIPPCHHKPMV